MLAVKLRLDRYLISELVGPLALGLVVYTFILLLQTFFRLAEFIIRRGLPWRTVGELLGYSLPNILVLTVPMSLLLAVLLGVGRLASDSELIALRATGVSLYRLMRPLLVFALLLGAFNLYLMLDLLPRGNSGLKRLMIEIAARTLGSQFEPRVFYNEFKGKVLYVFDADPSGETWRGVLLADSVATADRPSEVLVADRGRLEISPDGRQIVLQLENAIQHSYALDRPDRYETRRYERLRLLLRDRLDEPLETDDATPEIRNLTWSEAAAAARDPAMPASYRAEARVHLHKMYALPAACPVFALLAMPLAYHNRRGGKSSGFALSIGIVMLYYVLITQTEEAAIAGRMPASIAMWLPNVLLATAGLVMIVIRNRDLPLVPGFVRRSPLARRALDVAIRGGRRLLAAIGIRKARGATEVGSRTRGARGAGAARVVLRLPRLRLRFPNLIDRYVLKTFAVVLLLVLASGVSLLVITDFTEAVDEMLRAQPPLSAILRYYKYLSLQLAHDIAPVAVLVTTLVTFSVLSRTNELTACRALGISLFRLALPALAGAILVGAFFAAIQAQVLPASNQKVAEARAVMKGRPLQRANRSADRQWQMGAGRFMYNFLHYDQERRTLRRLQVFEFDRDARLVARLYSEEATFTPDGWVLSQGWTRGFDGHRQLEFRRFPGEIAVDLEEPPSFFADEVRQPSQMTFGELSDYVNQLRETGRPQPRYEVALHNKIAFPVGSVVMALVAFPFVFRMQRRGALYGLGVAIALGFSFILIYALFRTLGEVGALPPIIAVWSPSALFSMFAAYLFLGVRT
jgi:LPS export ABC transporter permease LptG/LPS export ABC transporter permease LptF